MVEDINRRGNCSKEIQCLGFTLDPNGEVLLHIINTDPGVEVGRVEEKLLRFYKVVAPRVFKNIRQNMKRVLEDSTDDVETVAFVFGSFLPQDAIELDAMNFEVLSDSGEQRQSRLSTIRDVFNWELEKRSQLKGGIYERPELLKELKADKKPRELIHK